MRSTMNLKLDNEGESNDQSRYLTIHANHILALGGENGVITALPIRSQGSSSNGEEREQNESRVIQQYDDVVKALAFSEDGKRVAVGYDDGNVDIYVYSDDDLQVGTNDHGRQEDFHPFICPQKKTKSDSDDDGDDDDFFTQSSQTEYGTSPGTQAPPTFRLQHRFEASIRHLQFQPLSTHQTKKYFLAIAAESSPGFMIVDVSSESTSLSSKYLDDEAKSTYKEGGIRSVSFTPHNNGSILSALGMDGRMSYWSTTSNKDPTLDWELIHADLHPVVNKADMGEFGDVGDHSLYPVWSACGMILGLPGSPELKFRMMEKKGGGDEEYGDSDSDWCKKNRMVLNMELGRDANGENSDDSDSTCIVGMAFDPENEGYVVTSLRNGSISLWKINKERKVNEPEGQFIKNITVNESMCTHILWHQHDENKEECLYLALQNGTMMTISGRDNIIPKEAERLAVQKIDDKENEKDTMESNKESQGSFGDDLEDDAGLETQPPEERIKDDKKSYEDYDMDDYDNHDDDDDDGDNLDNAPKSGKNQFVSDEAEENDKNRTGDDDESQFDDEIAQSSNAQDSQHQSGADQVSSTARQVDDIPMVDNEFENDIAQDDFDHHDNLQLNDAASVGSIVRPQNAFAPSSTPYGSRTILCWNHIGVITLRHDIESSIDIEFTDVMANRPIRFRDNMQFVMGSLGDEGAIFATDLLDDMDDDIDDNVRDALDGLNGMSEATKNVVKRSERRSGKIRATGSCVYFHRFNTFGPLKNKDWFVTLHEGEKVISCATGSGWNAVATSRRFLRSFTSGGIQGPVVWLKGDPVTMVGRGHFLAVFYHESTPTMDKTQKIGYTLYDGRSMREISSGSVAAISPESYLTWVGFSNEFALSVMDSNGILSMLMGMKPEESGDVASFSWVPMLDTFGLKKSKEDAFWPVCVQNGKLICVPLKGVPHPNPVRRPLTTNLQLRIPLAKDGKDKVHGMEEIAVRANLALSHKNNLNDFMINHCGENEEDLETEYLEMCKQVDKINLRLFNNMIGAGKVESALDLVQRLHNEDSFEIAMEIADRSNQRKLSDHIYSIKESRFDQIETDQHVDDDGDSYAGSVNTSFTQETQTNETVMKVSPEASSFRNKRKVQVEHPEKPRCRKRMNPFATNAKKSPGKSPPPKSFDKPTLSRMSTFSSQSRQLTRASKEIL